MNQVSDYKLACSAANAGITPGVFIGQISDNDLETYMNDYYNTNLIMSCRMADIINTPRYFIDRKIKFIEILRSKDIWALEKISKGVVSKKLEILKQNGIKIIIKGNYTYPGIADAITIQGKESAGVASELTTLDEFNSKKDIAAVIVSGGIHSSEQINYYMRNGALAVSIGTLFAACSESKLSSNAKNKLIMSSSSDLKIIGTEKKQALVWNTESEDTINFTDRLSKGITNPEEGIIYCGTSVDYITSVEPIANIVNRIIKQLDKSFIKE